MANYIEFETGDGSGTTILVEVSDEEVSPTQNGLEDIGIGDTFKNRIASAKSTFTDSLKSTIQHNVQAFIEVIASLPEPPTEVEITFGLKATGEIGNVAIGKASSEANYTVKLAWKQISKGNS